jgi:hypothetical protein
MKLDMMNDNKKKSFSKTVEKDGRSKTIRAQEVENGWVITIEKYNGDKYITKKYISTENPFDREQISPDESMMNSIKSGEFMDV